MTVPKSDTYKDYLRYAKKAKHVVLLASQRYVRSRR